MDAELFYVVVGSVIVAAIARRRGWPAPLLVTAVAVAVSFGLTFVPDFQMTTIDGHLLLNIVLPPLLYSAALDVSFVNFRRSMPQIRRLGIWLVLVTAFVVGIVAYLVMPSLTLPGALLLGAIVAPPDAVSAAAIGRKLGLPRRVMTVLSGESLINDATSLTLYRIFAGLLAGSAVTAWAGIWEFALAVIVGVGIGLLFGAALHQLRMRIADPVVIGTFGLLIPFGAYALAEALHGSGVLAVVAMGLFVGYNAPRTDYTTRQQEGPVWLSLDFLLESFVFAYIGLQFPRVLRDLQTESVEQFLLLGGVVLLVVLLVRPAFIYPAYAWSVFWQKRRLRRFDRSVSEGDLVPRRGKHSNLTTEQLRARIREPQLSWRDNAVISWAGMRGVVTLAIALAAADLAALGPEPSHAIVVVAFIVTVGTLMLQGLTLPLLIRKLGVVRDAERKEDARAVADVRKRSKQAGMKFIAEQRALWQKKYPKAELTVFDTFAKRMTKIETETDHAQVAEEATIARPSYEDVVALTRGWLHVRREMLLAERDAGTLDEEVMRELIAAIDAEELALDTRGATRQPGRV